VSSFVSGFAAILTVVIGLVQVNWASPEKAAISIAAPERQPEILECLSSALQARVRFDVRLCHRRSGWFDGCEESRSELHTVQFDEITESYRVVSDRFGDDLEPVAVGIPARSEAIKVATSLQDLPLTFLARDEQQLLDQQDTYIQVRTIFVCRGEVNRTLAHLSRIITLGLVNVVEDSSGWSDFELHPTEG
jgi:hypothetical protein